MDRFELLHDEVEKLEMVEGITPLTAADLPDPFSGLFRKMIRQGSMTLDEIAAQLDLDNEQAYHLGNHLATKGYLQVEEHETGGGARYRVYLARIRKHNLPIDF